MSISRVPHFAAAVAGSWLAGRLGACLVWSFIYSIGSRVVTDEIYIRLEDSVTRWGGAAGALIAWAMVRLLRRPAPGVLAAGHALAAAAGLFGGSVGWQEGLWAYFGTFVGFAICVALRELSRNHSHRDDASNAA